jgi:FeS assembly protein IscX
MPVEEENPNSFPSPKEGSTSLGWDDTYEIALALSKAHAEVNLEEVSLGMIYRWTIELPNFFDDHELANEEILLAIYQEWFEEVNSK